MVEGLPRYAKRLRALHRAHLPELREMVSALPLGEGERVLDVACGDGTYARLMSERRVRVTGLDANPAFLRFARREQGPSDLMTFVQGNALELPFEDGSFDGAFCAQSFYSLPAPRRVLRQMRRVVQRNGWVAALENDTLHRVILPWPPELEMKLRLAEHEALRRARTNEQKFYIGRKLIALFDAAGLTDVREHSFSTHRQFPLEEDERYFLQEYLKELRQRVYPHLEGGELRELEELTTPTHDRYLLDAPDFSVTYLDILALARVP